MGKLSDMALFQNDQAWCETVVDSQEQEEREREKKNKKDCCLISPAKILCVIHFNLFQKHRQVS